MNRMLIVAVALAAVLAGAYVGARSSDVEAPPQSAKVEPPLGATLLPGLGTYEFRITTRNPEAQRWFNQAFMLTYGFNHDAAERSYLKAAQLDPRLRHVLVGCGARAGAARQCADGSDE